jgi:hypothetical protein
MINILTFKLLEDVILVAEEKLAILSLLGLKSEVKQRTLINLFHDIADR